WRGRKSPRGRAARSHRRCGWSRPRPRRDDPTRPPIIPGDKDSNRWGAMYRTGSWWTEEEEEEEPMEAAGAVDAKNAPTAPWKPQNGFHELPQASPVSRSVGDISIEGR